MESLDYDHIDSVLELEKLNSRPQRWFLKISVQRWVITFFIGFFVALVGVGVHVGTVKISYLKLKLLDITYQSCSSCYWAPILVFIGANVLFVSVASVMVVWGAPTAAGSGIPEVKCYLNGIKIPEILRFKTLLAKPIGVMFTVSGGLCAGKEGPMIHTGAIIAAGISQGKSSTLRFLSTPFFDKFRNDHEKRDFVAGGAAAGVAAAFGAPIGGTLFSLEEGSSFWNQALTWRTFFCSMVTAFTLNFFLSGFEEGLSWGMLSSPGLINFGSFNHTQMDGYTIEHVPVFIVLGIIGGLLGALFNGLNERLTSLRMKYIFHSNLRRFAEAIFMAVFTVAVALFFSYFVRQCKAVNKEESADAMNFNFFCPEGTYNDMARLFTQTGETTIKHLLHDDEDSLSVLTLIVFVIIYFCLATITYGVAVPSGLFVPALTIGSAYGRLIGLLVRSWDQQISVGTFALIGAASFLGGCTRMTISLCVILIETTSDLTLGLPLMFTLMISKWVGDWFNCGIYDLHIRLRKIPILEWEASYEMRGVMAQEVMNRPVISFYPVERVGKIFAILKHTTHNGYPIVTKSGILQGIMLRSQIITILLAKTFQRTDRSLSSQDRPHLDLREFGKYYPRYPNIDTVKLLHEDKNKYIDFTPFMNLTPYIIQQTATGERTFRLFRTMGLRHLPVVDEKSHVVGMITRRDIIRHEEKIKHQPLVHHVNTLLHDEKDIELEEMLYKKKGLKSDFTQISNREVTLVIDELSEEKDLQLTDMTPYRLFKLQLSFDEDYALKSIYNSLFQHPSVHWLYIDRDTVLYCETESVDVLTKKKFKWPQGVRAKPVKSLEEISITPQALRRMMSGGIPVSRHMIDLVSVVFSKRKKIDLVDVDVLEAIEKKRERSNGL